MRFVQHRVALSLCLPLALALSACSQPPPAEQAAAPAAAPAQTPAERGAVLVQVGGCHDCHTTKKMGPAGPEPDMSKMLSGHPEEIKVTTPFKANPNDPWFVAANATLTAWSGPWGISYAANLTPDQNTGLGIWTEDMFLKALKLGKHMGTSRDILPPMPWQMYSKLSDDDLKAIFAYLRSIPPLANHVPEPVPPAGPPPAGN